LPEPPLLVIEFLDLRHQPLDLTDQPLRAVREIVQIGFQATDTIAFDLEVLRRRTDRCDRHHEGHQRERHGAGTAHGRTDLGGTGASKTTEATGNANGPTTPVASRTRGSEGIRGRPAQ